MKIFTANYACLFIKVLVLISLITVFSIQSFSQTGVSITTTTSTSVDPSALLDLNNQQLSNVNKKGLLLPRVVSTSDVQTPIANGLMVYQTGSLSGIYYYNGTVWVLLTTPANGNGNFILNQIAPTQNPGNFNITGSGTIAGTFTSSGGAINLNSPSTSNNAFATNINVGSAASNNTGTITIGGSSSGNGSQAVNIGTSYSGSSSNTISIGTGTSGSAVNNINIGTAATGSGTNSIIIGTNAGTNPTAIFSGSGGVSINTGTNTSPVTIGGTGPQTISIGASLTGSPGIINLGVNTENLSTNISGGTVNINNGATNKITNINAGGATGTLNIGGITSGTPSGAVNINYGLNITKPININTGTNNTGTVSIGGTGNTTNQTINVGGSGLQTVNVGTGLGAGSIVNIGSNTGDAGSSQTNIKSGTGGVNINASVNQPTSINTGNSNKDVTIGNGLNNLILPKFATNSIIFYTTAGNGTVSGLVPGSNGQVLTLSGGIPAWSSSIPSGSSDYIQNQVLSSQAANFWIGGPASIGTANVSTQQLTVSANTGLLNNAAIVGLNTTATGYAIKGTNSASNNNANASGGVLGVTSQSNSAGTVGGNLNSNGTGVFGIGNNIATASFLPNGSGGAFTGLTTGVYAFYSNGPGQAIYTSDNLGNIVRVNYYSGTTQYKIFGNGTMPVSCSVKDEQGNMRIMHAPETPEFYFEDYGEGKLANGKTHIVLDPVFAKNVVISQKHPLRVFIQLEGDCNGVFVTNKTQNGFDVIELSSGKSNTNFQWHIVCNVADAELGNGRISHNADLRLEKAPVEQLKHGANALDQNK